MRREITIDKHGHKSSGKWGFVGEKDITHLMIELPDELMPCDFIKAKIISSGEEFTTDKLNSVDGKVDVSIPLSCTVSAGKITVQIIGYVVDESDEIYSIGKTAEFTGVIGSSAKGKKITDTAQLSLLDRIWVKIQAWADKIHIHGNYNTLDYFSCNALDTPITDGDFNFGINTEDWNRLKFRGDTILFTSDGAVVQKVEEKEIDGKKFFRVHLNKPGITLDSGSSTPSFFDIPVSAVEEKTDISLNGAGLGLVLGNGTSYDRIELTAESATLEPNTNYSFGESATLTLEFAEGDTDKINEYSFTFISGETPTVLTLPSSVQWANELTVEANKRYEISIVDNIGLWCAVEVSK